MDQITSDSDVELKDESSLNSGCDSTSDDYDYDYEISDNDQDIIYNQSIIQNLIYENDYENVSGNELEFKVIGNNVQSDQQGDVQSSEDKTISLGDDIDYSRYTIEYCVNIDIDKFEDLPEDGEKIVQKQIESNCKYDFELRMVYNILLFMNTGFQDQNTLRCGLINGTCSINDEYYYDNRYYDIKSINNNKKINNNNNNMINNNLNDNIYYKNNPESTNIDENNQNLNNINNHNKNIKDLENYSSYTFKFNPLSCSFELNNNNFGNKSRFQS